MELWISLLLRQIFSLIWAVKNICLDKSIKLNYFFKQCPSSSFLITWSRCTGPDWPWSLSRLAKSLKWVEVCSQVLLGHFEPVYLLQVGKMMMKNIATKSNLALTPLFNSRHVRVTIAITCWINFRARKFTKFISKYELVTRFLINPTACACWTNFGARNSLKKCPKMSPGSRFPTDPKTITYCYLLYWWGQFFYVFDENC